MHVANRRDAPRYRRAEGITSFLLVSRRTCSAKHLTTTLVEIEPGGVQRTHSHEPEQIYFILEGRGVMRVGEEQRAVVQGDCVHIPSNVSHGIANESASMLRYFSAAAPSFAYEDLVRLWPLPPEGSK